ncbi:alanine-glyoxylate transaminase/serine-glyoxylate transaminase/serine-pyruvate transaminase [Natronospira proteinivora]|uniref:Alanine-glyoxylate transaminase/serine-glyoxylate transaminase/serine-pyruvate transaminase n=1 Tax=Natronospira proteinivora TaxID=1807133 RepID=A0ABT1G9B1_9GAMM|nr:alanine--glyoxylate aminotransferase family protein [Natronospira proteinivora]MCP1727831.1 alanine-glyoxylate transaminase/serine-glyoxylate transaminase/serine-pyruvate transaminase [Natronospira proteinivora]
MSNQGFYPPQRLLMGPGPSNVSRRVLEATARPTIGHLDPLFVDFMDATKGLLQWLFRTDNALTLPVSGPGTAGMEACFANLLEPGDEIVICRNGAFGQRMVEMSERMGARVVVVDQDWGRAVDVDAVEAALSVHPDARILAFVHAETSTGARSDARALARLAREHDCLSLMDCVTSLGGIPVELDAWEVDAAYAGTQKCLSCPPGLSPVSLSERAAARIRAREKPVQSWFMDFSLVMSYWGGGGKRAYHHTAPVNALYGLHEALLVLQEEGLEASWARHERVHGELVAAMEDLGLAFLVPADERLPQLNTVKVPEGVDKAAVRAQLLDEGIEIGAGLGPLAGKVWRVGLMGESARSESVARLHRGLRQALS